MHWPTKAYRLKMAHRESISVAESRKTLLANDDSGATEGGFYRNLLRYQGVNRLGSAYVVRLISSFFYPFYDGFSLESALLKVV
jgi:hypothetical protein